MAKVKNAGVDYAKLTEEIEWCIFTENGTYIRKHKSKDKESDPPLKSPLPPRPPSSFSNPYFHKHKLPNYSLPPNSSDSGFKVIVRMRPLCHDKDEGDSIVEKIYDASLLVNGHNFTFDSVAHTNATQASYSTYSVYLSHGNCLNSSIV